MRRGRTRRYDRRRTSWSARRRRVNWRAIFGTALAILAIGGIAAGARWALTTPRLVIRRVAVQGAEGELAARLARSVGSQCLGRHISKVDKAGVIKTALREPEVARAETWRRFPSTMVLWVEQRQPYAAICVGDASYVVDAGGIVLRKCRGSEGERLPKIYPAGDVKPVPGHRCGKRVRSALSCIADAAVEGLTVRKISVDHAGELCLNVADGFYVKMGAPIELAAKFSVLNKMMDGRPDLFNRIEYVDVSCPAAPAVMPRATQSTGT